MPWPFFVTRPVMPPVDSTWPASRIEIGDAGDVVGLQHAIGDRAGGHRDREHHGARRQHAPPAGAGALGFAERRVAQAEQVTEFVQGHGFEVDAAGFALRRHRPREARVEEHVGLDDRAVGGVDQEAGGAEHAIEIRPIEKARAWSGRRRCRARRGGPRNSNRTVADGTFCHVVVARATAPRSSARRDAGAVPLGDEIADRLLVPADTSTTWPLMSVPSFRYACAGGGDA